MRGFSNSDPPPEKTKIHPIGVDIHQFTPSDREPETNKKEVAVLTVGRLAQEKGIEYGIRAFSDLIKKCPQKNLRYYIVGDGPFKKILHELVSKLQLNEKIIFLGSLSQDELKVFHNFNYIIGDDPKFKKVLSLVEKVAGKNTTVLIISYHSHYFHQG